MALCPGLSRGAGTRGNIHPLISSHSGNGNCVELQWLIYISGDINIHTHTRLMALCPGLPGWAGTRKVKPIWIQETVSGSGNSWAIRKSASHSRQTTTPAPHHSVFYRPDALPVAQPTASKHWRQDCCTWRQFMKTVTLLARACSSWWWLCALQFSSVRRLPVWTLQWHTGVQKWS